MVNSFSDNFGMQKSIYKKSYCLVVHCVLNNYGWWISVVEAKLGPRRITITFQVRNQYQGQP